MAEDETRLNKAYKRAAIGLAAAAVLWFLAWLYAVRAGWEERSLVIPIACTVLSAIFFWLHAKSKQSPDN
jgi:sterol desaturase/sphingolipid hydroxylase (fatty acid hydroxylase superfamily)